MKLIFTTGKAPLSKIFKWALGTDCSHFAYVFDDCLVFQNNYKGAHVTWLSSFLKANSIVHEISFKEKLTLEAEEAVYKKIISDYIDTPYDYSAMMFWAVWLFFNRCLFIPMPKTNYWQKKDEALCTGLLQTLQNVFPDQFDFSNLDLEFIKPHDLYEMLCRNENLIETNTLNSVE